ncbi:MAG: type II toxin-antitoxin system YafQ family toxin [Bacteroidales bacterium]|nr:type II toxin-antitoxin system YafQ family toxin [Bacteroidales bacterium]
MKTLHPSSQFKKDVKRIRNNPGRLAKLQDVLDMLIAEITLPDSYKAHMLTGDYKDCMECHIEG